MLCYARRESRCELWVGLGTRCRGWLFRDRAGLGRIREEIYGADHIDVAKTCANLGNAFYQVRPSHTRFLLTRAFDTRSTC